MNDIGLKYMMELGAKPAKTSKQFYENLKKAVPINTADKIKDTIANRCAGEGMDTEGNQAFYTLKNQDLNTSLVVTLSFDGNMLRKACNYLDANRNLFGKTIVDIGCDNGILTCFIARLFPEASVTGIDCNEAGIRVAEQLAKKLNVTNVSFVCGDASQLPAKFFDTAVSLRVVHEIAPHVSGEQIAPVNMEPLMAQGEHWRAFYQPTAQLVTSCLKEDGTYISIERILIKSQNAGWAAALNDCGFVPERVEDFSFTTMEDTETFCASISKGGAPKDTQEICRSVFEQYSSKLNPKREDFTDFDAQLALFGYGKKLLSGIKVYDKQMRAVGVYAVWSHQYDDKKILLQNDNLASLATCVRDAELYEDILNEVESAKERAIRAGYRVMTINEDGTETEETR